jgi:exo-beta-1,3-glucanase (GH17 family)
MFYPYGDDVGFSGDSFDYLLEKGFKFFCGIWGTADYLDVESDYIHTTRRNIDGYAIYYNWDSVLEFFDPSEVLDSSRPSW